MFSFFYISQPKHCTYFCPLPPYVPHAPPISFFIWSPKSIWQEIQIMKLILVPTESLQMKTKHVPYVQCGKP